MKTILIDAVDCFISENGEVFKEMYDLLEQYPNRKIILTNADYKDTNKYGLNDAPYEVFTLKRNPMKTDPKYYETMLKHFNLAKEDVIYFEHNSDAVKSAQVRGIKTYFYDNEKKDLDALKEFLDRNLN